MLMYKCVDVIANIFRKKSERSLFEGSGGGGRGGICKSIVVQRDGKHCMVIE